MRTPIFMQDINYLGVEYYVEAEGYETLAFRQSGDFMFCEREILGWTDETLGEIWKHQQRALAPRTRYWLASEGEPTKEEREAAGWSDRSRMWCPLVSDTYKHPERWEEYIRTGRTYWGD